MLIRGKLRGIIFEIIEKSVAISDGTSDGKHFRILSQDHIMCGQIKEIEI